MQPWPYPEFENRSVTVVDELAAVMRANAFLKIYVSFGHTDGATPMTAAEHCLAALEIPADRQANIVRRYYPAGHLMYVHQPTRIEQSADLADSSGGPPTGRYPGRVEPRPDSPAIPLPGVAQYYSRAHF